MSTGWDEVSKEADLLRGAIITGTLKARQVELGPAGPSTGDTDDQRVARQLRARQRALNTRDHVKNIHALDRQLGVPSPYPDVHETYCTGDLWERELTETQARDMATDRVARGWPKDIATRLLRVMSRSTP